MALGCLVAGVAVLAGAGWALLAAGGLLLVTPVSAASLRTRIAAAYAGGARGLARGWGWFTAGRRRVATVAAPSSLLLVPSGVALTYGVGLAFVAAGVMLAAFSLLLGWNA